MSELTVKLAMELFKLDHLLLLDTFDAIESGQLIFSLRSELMLNILNESVQFLNSVLLGFLNFLDASLNFADVVFQVSKSAAQPAGLTSDQVNMALVYFLKLFELMALVRVAKEATVGADRYLASLAEVVKSSIMLRTQLLLAACSAL